MSLVHNIAKRKLRDGDIALGFGLHHLRSSAAPMLAAAAGHDYLFMDIEACEVEIFRELEATLRGKQWRPIIYMETHPQFYGPGGLEYLRLVLTESAYEIEEIGAHWPCKPRQERDDVRH